MSLPLITANRILNKPLVNKKSLNSDHINKVSNNNNNNDNNNNNNNNLKFITRNYLYEYY